LNNKISFVKFIPLQLAIQSDDRGFLTAWRQVA